MASLFRTQSPNYDSKLLQNSYKKINDFKCITDLTVYKHEIFLKLKSYLHVTIATKHLESTVLSAYI